MKRTSLILSIVLLLSLALAACSPAAPAPTLPAASPVVPTTAPAPTEAPAAGPIEIQDGLQRTVTLAAPAQRIVSLAPSNTEILFAIGAGQQVVGRDEFSDYPAQAKDLPSVGGSMGSYSLEAIAQLQPDLVLAAEINTPEQVKSIEDLGLTVFYLSNPAKVEDVTANIELVGRLAGREQEAAALAADMSSRIEAVKAKANLASSRPKVFYELDGSDPAKPWTSGPGTFMDQMLAMAGAENAAVNLGGPWGQLSQEELLVQNPDVILLGDAAYGTTPEQVAARAGWDALKAVQDERILVFDDNLVSRPGPRLVEGLETVARLLHPTLFE